MFSAFISFLGVKYICSVINYSYLLAKIYGIVVTVGVNFGWVIAPVLAHHFVYFDLLELLASRTDRQLISMQAGKVFNQDLYFKKTVKFVGEPMTHLEAIASSAVFPFPNATRFLRWETKYFWKLKCFLLLSMSLQQ